MRVVIQPKRDTNPQDVLQQLYHQTALSTSTSCNLPALVDGQTAPAELATTVAGVLEIPGTDFNRRYTNEL